MNFLKKYGPVLIENGYRICRIKPRTKIPLDKGWPDLILTESDCLGGGQAEFGVGIICGASDAPVVCLDADINDEKLASEFLSYLRETYGDTPVRFGNRPKFAALFATAEPWAADPSLKFEKKDGERAVKAELDFRGKGNQFVAYGIHPNTGKPYEWEGSEPISRDRDFDLLEISLDDKIAIGAKFRELALANGFTDKSRDGVKGKAAVIDTGDEPDDVVDLGPSPRLGIGTDEIERIFRLIDYDFSDYNDWIKAGMAIHHETVGSEEGLMLFDALSQSAESYTGFDDVKAKWDSFSVGNNNPVTMATFRAMVPAEKQGELTALTELGLILRLSAMLSPTLRYLPREKRGGAKEWARFKDGHWDFCSQKEISYVVAKVGARIIDTELDNTPPKSKARKQLVNMKAKYMNNPNLRVSEWIRGLENQSEMQALAEDFDKSLRYIGLKNGDFDLETKQFLEPDPSRLISKVCDIEYDPEADCPLWKNTVKECLDSEAVARYYQTVLGYSLLGTNKESLFFILVGNGCNGKSTVQEVVKKVFGDYQGTASSSAFLRGGSGGNAIRSDLVALKNLRLIELPETSRSAVLNESLVKRVTGGDMVSARALYREQEAFRISGVPFLITNHEPRSLDTSDGIKRRVKIIYFPRNFDKDPTVVKDVNLKEKLMKEASGIFNWIIEGLKIYESEGFSKPVEVELATKEYNDENDVMGHFIEETLEFGDKNKISSSVLYEMWKIWSVDNGAKDLFPSKASLTRELKRRLTGRIKDIKRSNGKTMFYGVSQRDPLASDNDEYVDDDEF